MNNKISSIPIQQLIANLDKIQYQNIECCYSSCQEKPINSHTISENYLYKLNPDLKEILTFQPSSVSRVSGGENPKYLRPIDKKKFSTFVGFCELHDNDLFKIIDEFNGNLDEEKATLIHYRNICYGVNHIETGLLRLQYISQQQYVGESEVEINRMRSKLKRGDYKCRLIYCLNEHKKRKEMLEDMIQSRNFNLIKYFGVRLGLEQPLFSGRSVRLLHPRDKFFRCDGYCYMPWLTYMTLRTNNFNHLVFVWLESDKEYAEYLTSISKQEDKFKNIIGGLAHSFSDAFAIRKEFYEKNQSLFIEAQKYRIY